ncbi:MAG TPA: AAA family ATPase, partial [Polyangiaceae bacterium]
HGRGYCFRAAVRELDSCDVRVPHAPLLPRSTDPFVGRDAILDLLVARLGQAPGGSENLVVLLGEAGAGKTRLARELSGVARSRGVKAWFGSAYEHGGAPAYWPWIQLLRACHEELSDPIWRRHLGPGAWAIAQLMPELELTLPAVDLDTQLARFQLFQEVTRFFKSAALDHPVLLILDDLQWADPGTIELCGFVARALQEAPILLLATQRTGELPADVDTPGPLDQLGRLITPIGLPGLTEGEVSELARLVTGQDAIESKLVRALHDRTRGNPLFVRQSLDLIAQRGDWSVVEGSAPALDLPPAIRQVIRRRLSGLSEACRRTLQTAAVIGTTFEIGVLARVRDSAEESTLDALEPARRIGLIEAGGSDAARERVFSFTHTLVKDSLYEELSLRDRGEIHARVATALSGRHARSRSADLAEIADHELRALPFDCVRAATACRRAARVAQEASGFEAAARLLSQAVRRLEVEGGEPRDRSCLLIDLGENEFYAGRIARAWSAFRAAADSARVAAPELLADVAPRLVDCLELGAGDVRVARSVVDQGLQALSEDASAARAGLLAQRAEVAVELSTSERIELLDQAALLATQSQDAAAILEVAHSRAILRDPTRLAENARDADHFFALTEQYPEAAGNMRYRSLRRFGVCMTRYVGALTACDVARADAQLEQCQAIARASQVGAARFATHLMLAGRALGDGRLSDLETLLARTDAGRDLQPATGARVFSNARATEDRLETAAWLNYGFALMNARGSLDGLCQLELDPALSAYDDALRDAHYFVITSARIHALIGNVDRARALLLQLPMKVLTRMPVQYGDLGALCTLVEISCAEQDRTSAERLYEQLRPHAALNAVGPTFEYFGSVAHYLGLLARLLGRPSLAEQHFQAAIEVNRSLGMPLQVEASEDALRSAQRQ